MSEHPTEHPTETDRIDDLIDRVFFLQKTTLYSFLTFEKTGDKFRNLLDEHIRIHGESRFSEDMKKLIDGFSEKIGALQDAMEELFDSRDRVVFAPQDDCPYLFHPLNQ